KGANRVWVHTCNLDGPQALKNYMARGFEVVHVDEEPMPDRYK
ncbi:MAG: GNAT family N-acetyltransferase, partial [Anaerolineae bacterium UTCFX5]